jgi:hypothetical protein
MTPQEEIDHERHIAEILRIRKPQKNDSRLEVWLNSNVLTALVGVLGTALLGAWVAGMIQDHSKKNELARANQERKLESQSMVVTKVLDLASVFMSATDDMLVTVNNAYSENNRSTQEIEELRKWKKGLREARDAADLSWRREEASLSFRVHYLFDQSQDVKSSWDSLVKTESLFENCTNNWYTENAARGTNSAPKEICSDKRTSLSQAAEAFAAAADSAQRQPE